MKTKLGKRTSQLLSLFLLQTANRSCECKNCTYIAKKLVEEMFLNKNLPLSAGAGGVFDDAVGDVDSLSPKTHFSSFRKHCSVHNIGC